MSRRKVEDPFAFVGDTFFLLGKCYGKSYNLGQCQEERCEASELLLLLLEEGNG